MSPRSVALGIVTCALASTLAASAAVDLTGVEVTERPEATVVELAGTGAFDYTTQRVSDPDRFVIDLHGAVNRSGTWRIPVTSPYLRRVRIGQFRSEPAPVVRVVLDLKAGREPAIESSSLGLRLRFGTLPASVPTPAITETVPRVPGRGASFTLPSPYPSKVRTERLVESLALRIELELEYREGRHRDLAWKLASTSGLEQRRYFHRSEGPNRYRTLELAISPHPTARHQIHVYSQRVSPEGRTANPDLALVRDMVSELASIPLTGQGRELGDLGLEVVQLSFTQVDRALALLKALGYSVVEFTKEEGDSIYDVIYKPQFDEKWQPPLIVKLVDAPKTSIMDEFVHPDQKKRPTTSSSRGKDKEAVPDIGGTFLHNVTSGEPQQRLLVVYERDHPEPVEFLLNLIREKIDVPAQQIVIEALVIEIDTEKLRDIGVEFSSAKDRVTTSFERGETGSQNPFTFMFDRYNPVEIASFKATLTALVSSGEAELLSSPSVLVLDGRQARIQVGQQVPVVSSTATVGVVSQKVEYFPVGIVLNLRPRIAADSQEVTMQVETIISAVSQESDFNGAGSDVFIAPTVDNRQVQTFVRVADNTPFIIGGLISSLTTEGEKGVPGLSRIPLLGNLFKRQTKDSDKREVIVVLTPHIVPLEAKDFSYVIPKEDDFFDRSFGHRLFRNAYRLQSKDVFDLNFVLESDVLGSIVEQIRVRAAQQPGLARMEPYASILEGSVPGEEILVRRMLYETVEGTGFSRLLPDDKMLFFMEREDGTGIQTVFLHQVLKTMPRGMNVLELTFEANPMSTPERPFAAPTALLRYHDMTAAELKAYHLEANRRGADGQPTQYSILIGDDHDFLEGVHPLERLKRVLVLKKILSLNATLPLTIRDFYVGRQIIYPSENDISGRIQVIGADAAKLFFEVEEFYYAFEQEFNSRTRELLLELQRIEAGLDPASELDGEETVPPTPAEASPEEPAKDPAVITEARRLFDSDDPALQTRAYEIALALAETHPEWTEAQHLAAEASFHQEN